MNNEEKFKSLLSDKLESKEFHFDQKHWVSMSDMIDRSREKKLRGAWLYILLIASVAGSLAVYLLSASDATEVAMQHTSNSALRPAPTTPAEAPTAPGQPLERTGGDNPENIKAGEVTRKQVVSPAPETRPTPEPEVFSRVSRTQRVAPEQHPVSGTKPQGGLALAPPPATTAEAPPVQQPNPEKESPADPLNDPSVAVEKPATMEPLTGSVVASESIAPLTTNATEPAKAASDSAATAAAVQAAAIVLPETGYVRHHLYLEAGMVYLNGWKTNDVRDGRGINWTGSVQYAWSVTRKLALITGLGYSEVGHLGAYSHSSKNTSYSFGERSTITTITPEKMCYLQVPFKVDYRISEKQRFGFGYVFSSLLTVKSRVESYTEGYAYSSGAIKSRQFGYTEGFNNFDSQISVFYKHRIHPQLWVNAELLMGIMDSRTNSFFGTPAVERNSGIKVSVLYNIFKK